MSDLQAYLAQKYMSSGVKRDAILSASSDTLSGASAVDGEGRRKKKKRKLVGSSDGGVVGGSLDKYGTGREAGTTGGSSGLVIDDDDGMAWARQRDDEDDEENRPVVEEKRGQFRAKASTSWSTVRPAEPTYERSPSPPPPADEAPAIVGITQDEQPPSTAPEAPRGGLQSAAQLKAENERRKAELARKKAQADAELEAIKQARRDRGQGSDDDDDGADPHATVYRDASGKKIDLKVRKAEEAQRKREDLEKQMKKMEWGKGLVQRSDREEKAREAERLKQKGIARPVHIRSYADDQDLNEEQRNIERWNDPAANFLTKKKEKKTRGPVFPKYAGPPPPPNRFGIMPGYRWDGVDRSNGFESQLMQKINSRSVYNAAAHADSTEDM
ncbi:Pre-mRNA-splicing factor cwc26 [Microbotryomycetes sp. JL201]|nr:Pre-mRNA-splicing factor cwc26 [Microbotryomycetes sp. JL201]